MKSARIRSISMRSFVLWAALATCAAGCTPKYPKCEKDDHCKDKGEICVEGACQQCRDATQCTEGQICNGGRCEAKPECSGNGECTDNKICRSGKCQLECGADGDCGSGMKCSAARCVDKMACNTPADCGGGPCNAGRCASTDNASRDLCARLPTVKFGFNDADLTEGSRKDLADAVPCFKDKRKVTIYGHADERGTEEFNLALGDRRARAVMKYLSTLGVPASQLDIISKGELEPADSSHDEGAWEKNRRAEISDK